MSRTGHIAGLLVLTALVAAVASAMAASNRPHPATAFAQAYARQDPSGARHDLVTADGHGDDSGHETRVTASTSDGKGAATAFAAVEKVNVFDGLVTADEVRVRAQASDSGTSTSGAILNLAIDGQPQEAPDGRTEYDLNGYGKMVALGSGPTGILGLRIELTQDYKAAKAGSVVTIGYASAKAQDEVKSAATHNPATAAPAKQKARKRKRHRHAQHAPRTARQKLEAALTKQDHEWAARLMQAPGYAFPVAGKHNFTDTYGAARADVPAHLGVDIFADYGTPIVAVADGRLYRVGTLKISGNRLWLRDKMGNRYFYCHLSDFAASAYNGADVKAGEIIGFVGSTGDAEQTPPHLHFEVHMPDGAPVNPTPYAAKWDKTGMAYKKGPGARPGALVVVKDFLAEG